jgi:predicted aspartyl protease
MDRPPVFFCALLILLAALACSSAQQNPPASLKGVCHVPFVEGSLEAFVNGQGPFRFGLDTGASGSAWVSPELARRLDLPVIRRIRAHDGDTGEGALVDVVRISTLTIGTITYRSLAAPVVPQHAPDKDENSVSVPAGTLGFQLFESQLITIDGPQDELFIEAGALPEPDGKGILGYTLDHTTAVIPIRLGSLATTAEVDTGGAGEISIPLSLARKLPLDPPLKPAGAIATSFRSVPLYTAKLKGDLVIGSVLFHNPKLLCSELLPYVNLGRDLLRRFRITFDQRNHRLRFVRDTADGSVSGQ